ncbi:pyridoxine 5'-phosphate synthase [Lichenihabitans psoromatis]|uniref:pyridoxine 5'-phosphate synthase n=1 Tax=Lichenihabitans psoromatis TaxID=2528642 RepID=UPI001036820E|nr:pyridoxine 5'-phosphate synthase [Lichenihabitans psoromatis]
MSPPPLRLGLNIDHVATVRNARGGRDPDPVAAALLGVAAGCDGITAHLREDRRHIRDEDIARLKRGLTKPLNFEMAATPAMMQIALATLPHAACLVPEKREERTTEGGLNVVDAISDLRPIVAELSEAGIRVSLFIEPSIAAIEAASALRAPVVELHTGRWCEAIDHGASAIADEEYERLWRAAERAQALGIECHAGHGLNYETARIIAAIPQIVELNIGHFIIGDAISVGLTAAVQTMLAAMRQGRGSSREASA